MTSFSFHKMHGLGNDFMLINTFDQPFNEEPAIFALLADRHLGVGFDQVLLIGPSETADVRCQIYNADGSEAEQCGNGMRCVARFVHEEKIISKEKLTIETKAGLIHVDLKDKNYEQIRVNMGVPLLSEDTVKVVLASDEILELTTVSMGNPHAIARVEDLALKPLAEWGREVSKQAAFPDGVNFGLMEVLNEHRIHLRTHERGVGETRACGSNACAAVIIGISKNWLSSPVEVEVACGKLLVEWAGSKKHIFLTGPATRVYSATLK